MEKEFKLVEAYELDTKELAIAMSNNYDMYDSIRDEIYDMNIEYELELINDWEGVELIKALFGSIYNGDLEIEITDYHKFYEGLGDITDNESTYELATELKELIEELKTAIDLENEELIELLEFSIDKMETELLNSIVNEIDDRAMLEGYTLLDVVYEYSDHFNNSLEGWYFDVNNNYKLYSEFEAEEYLDEED